MGENYIYHLVQGARWKDVGGDGYLPATYEADGFIHATKEAGLLLPVANHFYTDVPGSFICLRIDTTILKSEVRFEPAAPVGDKPAHSKAEAEGGSTEQDGKPPQPVLFPHIYGPIDSAAVVAELAVERSDDGGFLSIEGIC
ncbi:unnamed protein product [Ectocarpus fasciculatus]